MTDEEIKLCECGCGEPAPIAKQTNTKQGMVKGKPQRFVHGHHARCRPPEVLARMSASMKAKFPQREPPNPSGLCMCGCGEMTTRALESDKRRGTVEGEYNRYLPYHASRGREVSEETREKLRIRMRYYCASRGRFGQDSYAWKRGWHIDALGYIVMHLPGHPMANSNGGVPEHRLIMANHLGRMLEPEERVHHKTVEEGGSGSKSQNNIENLILFANDSEHLQHHAMLRRLKCSDSS